jgi:hypothetical protein
MKRYKVRVSYELEVSAYTNDEAEEKASQQIANMILPCNYHYGSFIVEGSKELYESK